MRTLVAALILTSGLTGPALAKPLSIPLSAAMAQCDQPRRDDAQDQAMYRACVHAKSGKYPPSSKPRFNLQVYGTARIGIVHELR